MDKTAKASAIGALIVLLMYLPLLMPLADRGLVFAYGDFTAMAGQGSAAARSDFLFYTFNNGRENPLVNRAFLVEGISLFTGWLSMTDSQTQSLLILITICIGSWGVSAIARRFAGRDSAVLALVLIPFYFLNLWSVERIGHFWIWLSYAVFPAFIALGLSAITGRKGASLAAYSLLFGIFGVLPHSFIYMLSFHLVLSAYCIFRREGLARPLMFLIVPLAIYGLLNIPLFLLPIASSGKYPGWVDDSGFKLLSRYGSLENLLTFTDNWWPQVPPAEVLQNIPFRVAAAGTFALLVLVAMLGYPKARDDLKALMVLCLLGMTAAIFVAQGTNNPLLTPILEWASGQGLSFLIGPFREWARIALLLPALLCLICSIGAGAMGPRTRFLLVILGLAVAAGIVLSPAREYLNDVYSPAHPPPDYDELAGQVSGLQKTVWLRSPTVDLIGGLYRYAWNTSKAMGPITDAIGDDYPYTRNGIIRLMSVREPPPYLLNALNIGYVIMRQDRYGGSGFLVGYGWLDCGKTDYFTLCRNDFPPTPFSVPRGTVFTTEEPQSIFTAGYFPMDGYALSSAYDDSTAAFLLDDPIAPEVMGLEDAQDITPASSGDWTRSTYASFQDYLSGRNIDFSRADYAGGPFYTSKSGTGLRTSFNVSRSGDYRVFVRILEGGDGIIELSIDGKPVSSLSGGQGRAAFRWTESMVHLGEGEHELNLTAGRGVSAVDSILLASEADASSASSAAERMLSSAPVIYALDAEADFAAPGTHAVLRMPDSAWGSVLMLDKSGPLSRDVDLAANGTYTAVLRGEGDFNLTIGNRTMALSSGTLGDMAGGPLELPAGPAEITIEGGPGSLFDALYIYSSDSKPGDLLAGKPAAASVEGFRKLDPTDWEVSVNASGPFLLSFAEGYDQRWVARVYRDGKLVETAIPVRLYGLINGYEFNSTGDLDIRLAYAPQEGFGTGLALSALTILGCLAYIGYEKAKEARA
jgi:hypothetical protein